MKEQPGDEKVQSVCPSRSRAFAVKEAEKIGEEAVCKTECDGGLSESG